MEHHFHLLWDIRSPAEGHLPPAKQPEMYRIWYEILIRKACRIAKGLVLPRPEPHMWKDNKPSPLALMDKCLDTWAANLIKALSEDITRSWRLDQHEAVYQELYVLGKKTWFKIHMPLSERAERKEIVESVLSFTPKRVFDGLRLPYLESMLPKTESPALPVPFPKHVDKSGLPLTDKLQKWKVDLLKEFDIRQVYKKLAKGSHERLALMYLFEVLLLDSLKDAILEDGPKDAATSLCNMTLWDFCDFIQNKEGYPWRANYDILFEKDQKIEVQKKRKASPTSTFGHTQKKCPPPGNWTFKNTFLLGEGPPKAGPSSQHLPHPDSQGHPQQSLGATPLFAGRTAQRYYGVPAEYYI